MTAITHPPTASVTDPPALTIMQPGDGATGWLGTIGVQFKLSGTQTNGAVSVPARMIEIISPSGFESFFRELSEVLAGGPPDPEQLMPLAARYGIQLGQPNWLPDVIARYNLTPPM